MMEHNTWQRKEDLENIKKVVAEFERKLSKEVI